MLRNQRKTVVTRSLLLPPLLLVMLLLEHRLLVEVTAFSPVHNSVAAPVLSTSRTAAGDDRTLSSSSRGIGIGPLASYSHITTTKTTCLHAQSSSSSSSSSSSTSSTSKKKSSSSLRRARDLIRSLVEESKCYETEAGARAFADVCAPNVVYDDRYEPKPFVGRTAVAEHLFDKVLQRKGKGGVRLDRISDGDLACGFAWTWVSGMEEGLRGTTFVELNADTGEIQYVQEIPEPIFKPGNFTKELLQAVTADAVAPAPVPFEAQTPTAACDVAKYLFGDLQNAEPQAGMDELLRFFDEDVLYRDFNFDEPLRGTAEVKQFVEDFNFPGIEFRPVKFDDGIDSTCFTWEVVLQGFDDDTIKGISYYELDPDSRKIVYVRDVPESAIKPPILGKIARQLRPGLGVFQGVPVGSRPGGK